MSGPKTVTVLLTVTATWDEGPRLDPEEVAEVLAEEIDALGEVWADNSGYSISVTAYTGEAARRAKRGTA